MSRIDQPLTLACGQTPANRLMKAGLSEQLSDREHAPTSQLEHLHERWGRGGCGLVVTGNVTVDRLHLASIMTTVRRNGLAAIPRPRRTASANRAR